jgi:ribosomal protein L35AE/L33A
MPSWKKVVASGSDASFSSLTVDTYVSASSFNGSFTGSLQGTASQAISSSYALTASYALNGGAAGFPFTGSAQITGSLGVTGSFSVNGNTGQTVFASDADTLVISGSLIITGSASITGSLKVSGSITGSLFGTASSAVSSSYAYTASSAVSSSYALTASYALFAANGGGGGVSAIYILDEGVVQGTASYFDFTGAGVTATVNAGTASIYIPGGGGGSNTNSQNAILSQTSPAMTWSFTHNLSTLYPVFTIYDNEDNVIIPQKIHAETTASAFIYFSSARSGTAVASKGGDITSASFAATASLANFATSASYSYTASSAISASFASTASKAQDAEDILVYVKNSTGAQINKGAVVRISGSVGDNPLISLADWTDDANSANTIGFAYQNILNDGFGYVITEGRLIGVDTDIYTAGQLIYLGTNGAITGSAPRAPLHAVRLGQVLRVQQNNGSIYVRVDNGYELGELHDVVDNTTTSSFGDLLVKSGSVWINSKQLTGSYALTGSLTITDTLTAQTLVVQTITSSILYSSGSNNFGNDLSNRQTFTGSLNITGSSVNLKDGAFSGSGANLFGIPATGITGLNLSQISSGSVSASISPNFGLLINTSVSASNFTGSFTGSLAGIATSASYASFALTASYSLGGSGFPYSGSAVITGSFLVSQSLVDFSKSAGVTGSFTGSLFGTASYATFALSASFAPGFTTNMSQSNAATTWSFTHNLNTINPIVQVYDLTNSQIIPNQIVGMNNSTAEIRFDYAQAGYAVASNGGGLYVTGSTSTLVQTVGAVTWSFTHNLNNKYNTYEVYDDNDYVLIPSAIKALTNNTAELYFSGPQTGRAVAQFSGINGAPNATSASYAISASFATNAASASYLNPITNSYVVLTQVSQSLNYVDDVAAAAGGVPLGGIYRNGNFILIRLS